jgi:AraC-like DNA-binding protein
MEIPAPAFSQHWTALRHQCRRVTHAVRNIPLSMRVGETVHSARLHELRPYQVAPGWRIGVHTHSFYEAHLFVSGLAYYTTTSEQPVGQDSVVVHGPGIPHAWLVGDVPVLRLVLWFDLAPVAALPADASWPVWPDVLTEAALLLHDAGAGYAGWADRAVHRMTILFSRLLALGAAEGDMSHVAGARESLVKNAEQFMRDNLAQPLTLADIASHVGLSVSSVAHQFSREIGQPPMARLFGLRMTRAAELLMDTTQSLAAIGGHVGMPDPSYFCRRFREHYGVTPGQYRRRLAHHPTDAV